MVRISTHALYVLWYMIKVCYDMLNVSLDMVNVLQNMVKGCVDMLYVIRDMIQVSLSMGMSILGHGKCPYAVVKYLKT
jgi:hypothetical protein